MKTTFFTFLLSLCCMAGFSQGNVGIGTTTPNMPLTLQANASEELLQFRSSSGTNKWHIGLSNSGTELNIGETGVANNRLVMMPGGSIGINTTNMYLSRLAVIQPIANLRAGYFENTYSGFNDGYGIYARSVNSAGYGYGGYFEGGYYGIQAKGIGGTTYQGTVTGIYSEATGSAPNGYRYGVYATASGGSQAIGIYATVGIGSSNYAGFFQGNVFVNGTLSKAAGTFKIDHPVDPANKYLVHSFVESPDMMNVYNGNVTTGANGEAVVQLPSYFEAANIDYKYQLTVIGQFAQAIVFKEISNNQFTIKTDKPNVKVSWQVTGVRNDAYAQKHRIVPEVEKTGEEKGKYLQPELFHQPAEKAIGRPAEISKKPHQ